MEARAKAKYIRISPNKARLVADQIRGKKVQEALDILAYTPKKAAKLFKKVVDSALANAEYTQRVDVDNLYIKKVYVDPGPMLKRWRARAMGRATRIFKRTSHLTVVLDEL